jgi:hypothetical protein
VDKCFAADRHIGVGGDDPGSRGATAPVVIAKPPHGKVDAAAARRQHGAPPSAVHWYSGSGPLKARKHCFVRRLRLTLTGRRMRWSKLTKGQPRAHDANTHGEDFMYL